MKGMENFAGQQIKDRIDPYNHEIAYNELMYNYDFDPEDRPCVYPNDSYHKYVFPQNKNFGNLYGGAQTAGGQAYDADWSNSACTNFLG